MHAALRFTAPISLVAMHVLLHACAPSGRDREPRPLDVPPGIALAALVESQWTVLRVGGKAPPAGAEPTLSFREIAPNGNRPGVFEGRVGGSGGVNQTGAQVSIGPEDAIRIGPVMSTMMAGPEAHMEFERTYLGALQTARTYEVSPDGDLLTISGETDIVHKRAPAPD